MNILSINNFNMTAGSKQNIKYNSVTGVSFGVKMKKTRVNDTFEHGNKMSTIVEKQVEKNNQILVSDATTFMDALEAIANKLKEYGITFDRDYCEPNAIKSPGSVVSKMVRAGVFRVPDRIRGTLYCKNIYDVNLLVNMILPEFYKRGYNIADTNVPLEEAMKRGKIPTDEETKQGYVKLPDIDLRLSDIAQKRNQLPENLQYSVGSPQPSGYEDIQIRFEKRSDLNDKNPKKQSAQNQLHELIILVGPTYAQVKHDESDMIYNYTRQFKELHILSNDKVADENIARIKRYTDLVKKMFNNEITQKIYENAKSYDMYGISEPMPISLSKKDEKILTSYSDEMEKLTNEYYKQQIETANDAKIAAMFKKAKKEDLQRLANIRQGLTKAIRFYKNYPDKMKKMIEKTGV